MGMSVQIVNYLGGNHAWVVVAHVIERGHALPRVRAQFLTTARAAFGMLPQTHLSGPHLVDKAGSRALGQWSSLVRGMSLEQTRVQGSCHRCRHGDCIRPDLTIFECMPPLAAFYRSNWDEPMDHHRISICTRRMTEVFHPVHTAAWCNSHPSVSDT